MTVQGSIVTLVTLGIPPAGSYTQARIRVPTVKDLGFRVRLYMGVEKTGLPNLGVNKQDSC